jgi:tetratricopeptide (TPR) repeat protein
MTRSGLSFLLLLAFGTAALADGFRDFNAGVGAAQRDDHDTAIKLLTSALASADLPEHLRTPALLARGDEYLEKKQYDLAIADFTQAIAHDNSSISAYIDRCASYAYKDMIDKALADCSSAIALDPHNWRLREARNAIYLQQKNFDALVVEYSTFIAERPDDEEILLGRADMLQYAGQFDRAMVDAEHVRKLAPNWYQPYAKIAQIYFAEGKYQAAADSFDDVANRVPNDEYGYTMKGQALWAAGQFHDAARAFEKALDHGKPDPFAFLWLSMARAREGAKASGSYAEDFADVDKNSWPGKLVLLYLGKNTPDALVDLKGLEPGTIEDIQCSVGFFVGEWYVTQGKLPDAKRLLSTAVKACDFRTQLGQQAQVELGRLP